MEVRHLGEGEALALRMAAWPTAVAAVAATAASAGSNPAMYVMSEVELAEQSSKMDALAAKWRKRQQQAEVIEAQQVGWCPNAERINGRFAMFFLVTGLITEYYT